jgi:peroxiredoxin Q/BCP
MLEIDKKAPQFCNKNQDEKEICLKDFKGQWVILYFYPKDNTPGCTTEACDFTAQQPQFKNLNANIIGVSPDDIKRHQKFIEKHNLNVELLSDIDKTTCESYGVWQEKKMCGRVYMGVVRSTFIIDPNSNIRHIWSNVKVRRKKTVKGEKVEFLHVNEVREKLIQLQG